MGLRSFAHGFRAAFNGIIFVLQNERNAKVQLMVAVVALLFGLAIGISNAELAAVFFAIIIVFVAEIFNTAIEKTLNLIVSEQNPQVGAIKDIAAGAVLVASIGAAAIGVAVFYPHIAGWLWPQ